MEGEYFPLVGARSEGLAEEPHPTTSAAAITAAATDRLMAEGVPAQGETGMRGQAPQTGHWLGPVRAYRIAARLSCSASGAAAGSPWPPTDAQVPMSNWYLPR